MQLSNRLTFSLASLIVLFGFLVMPVLAHDQDEGTDGIQHTGVGTLTDAEHTSAHKKAPTVSSIKLYDVEVGGTSTARDGSVQLVADVNATTPALRDTANDNAGQFAVVVTFSEAVFTDIVGTDGTFTIEDNDLANRDVLINAAARKASGTNLVNQRTDTDAGVDFEDNFSPLRLTSTTTPTLASVVDGDEVEGQVYLIVFTVNDATADKVDDGDDTTTTDDDSIDVWITVNADAMYNKTGLVGGDDKIGTGNTASERSQFTIVKTLPAVNTRPTLTITSTAPTDAVTTGSHDITYTTSDADGDTVTVAAAQVVVPSSAATHYTIDTTTLGTVTVNQAVPSSTVTNVPAASVTVTLTPRDAGGPGGSQNSTVFFAPKTYTDSTPPTFAEPTTNDIITDTKTGVVTATLTFSEALKAGSLSASGTATPTGNDATYTVAAQQAATGNVHTVTVTPNAITTDVPALTVTITVSAMDTSDNALGTTGNTFPVSLPARTAPDTTKPVVAATDVTGAQSAAFDLMFTVTEANLPSDGIVVTGSPDATAGKYTIGAVMMGDDATATNDYKVTITPTPNVDMAETTVTFTITATDASNNSATATAMATLAARSNPATLRFVPLGTSIDDQTFTAGTPIGTPVMPYVQLPRAAGGAGVYTYALLKGVGEANVTTGDGNGLSVDLVNLRLMGTPTAAAASTLYTWRVTDAQAHGDVEGAVKLTFNVTVNAAPTPANKAPEVKITTPDPTTPQMGSFAIAYTVTDENAGDTYTLTHGFTTAPTTAGPSYTTSHDAATKTVTITQSTPAPLAVISVTITATDAGGLKGSDSIVVSFVGKGAPPADTTAPTVAITVAPAANMTVQGTTYTDVLSVTLDFNEPINADTLMGKIGRVGGDNYSVVQISDLGVSPVDNTIYTGYVNSPGYRTRAETRVLLKRGVADLANNAILTDQIGIYKPPAKETVPPTVTIGAEGYMVGTTVRGLNCEVGNALTFTYADGPMPGASGVKTGSMVEASEVSVVTAGWEKKAIGSQIWVVPKTDRSALGVTAITVKVAAGAIEDNNGNKSAEAMMTFTVGPVLTIPAKSYIVVVRTNAYPNTHLSAVRTLYLADPNVEARQPMVQYWDCMPDLSLVFDVKPTAGHLGGGRLGTGGGGLLLLESYEQDKNVAAQAIAKGTVGISEIMWAQDQGTTFGRTSNLEHAQEQWIELHNFSGAEVKVTLFDIYGTEAYSTAGYTGEIDRVSNFNIGGRWEAGDRGQDGDRDRGIDFISMQRTTPTDAAKNYSHGDHNGTNGGKWSKSSYSYLTRRAVLADRGIDLGENNLYDFYGTPGRQNSIKYDGPITRTDVKRSPVIFNEIANRTNSNRYYEWIELRNVTDAEVNLREYRISYVTAKDTETELYTFPDNDDTKIPAQGVLLLVDTDPKGKEDHPIAADNPNMKYKVADFKGDGLPDDGMFVLFLRKNNGDKPADLKNPAHVIDLAGYDDNLADPSKHTSLWPLNIFGAPDARNKIEVETVHHRQHVIDPDKNTHGDDKDEHQALRDAGYTGIGYKRLIPALPAHGGTPGYKNNVAKEYNDGNATASAAPVTISEVMYHTTGGRLPQWIELYNSSKTEVVRVEDWTLQLENADDVPIRTPRVSVKLKAKLIQPNQTILIVASTTGNNSDHFPDSRVIDIWGNGLKDKDRLEIDANTSRREFKILSETAFKITLKDKAGKVVDTVGNRGADWDLPEEGENRSSLIRRYDEGVARDGTLSAWSGKGSLGDAGGAGKAAWVLATSSGLYETQDDTYYGNVTDEGSPGYRGGGPVPVSLSKFRPERLDDGSIVVRWITESELNNAGFNILRSETKDGEYTQLNTNLIAGQGTTSERTTYTYSDTSAKPNVVYYYQIQDVSLDGKVTTLRVNRLKGHISAAGKATTTWGKLKALQ